MQLGAFDYVMKPVALDELLEKVRQTYEKADPDGRPEGWAVPPNLSDYAWRRDGF
jgi:DNA-binding response OmpR family regulator